MSDHIVSFWTSRLNKWENMLQLLRDKYSLCGPNENIQQHLVHNWSNTTHIITHHETEDMVNSKHQQASAGISWPLMQKWTKIDTDSDSKLMLIDKN